jgi:hypothetical protein
VTLCLIWQRLTLIDIYRVDGVHVVQTNWQWCSCETFLETEKTCYKQNETPSITHQAFEQLLHIIGFDPALFGVMSAALGSHDAEHAIVVSPSCGMPRL